MENEDDAPPAFQQMRAVSSIILLLPQRRLKDSWHLSVPPSSVCPLGRGRRLRGIFSILLKLSWWSFNIFANPSSSFLLLFHFNLLQLPVRNVWHKTGRSSWRIHRGMYLRQGHTSGTLRDVNYWFAVSLDNPQSSLPTRIDSDSFLGRAGCAAAPFLYHGGASYMPSIINEAHRLPCE